MTANPMDFYSYKGTALPRFVYRHLAVALRSLADTSERQRIIADFLTMLAKETISGDYLKMKWVMPTYLRQILRPDECELIETKLSEMRSKRNRKIFDVFPHCADEFGLESEFLESVFRADPVPLFDRTTPIFTIGSCFARNIAVYLSNSGYQAQTFGQAEDLNSPLSNALMLGVATGPEAARLAYLQHWVGVLVPGEEQTKRDVVDFEMARLAALCKQISESRLLVVTLGNTIDYFLPADSRHPSLGDIQVAPKFLSIANAEDVGSRSALSAALKRAGAAIRLSTFVETKAALNQLYRALRAINPLAPIVFTLSPVPIDSAIGIEKADASGAIELDCISKSTLRTAIAELLPSWMDAPTYYFPSYEIVRWVGGMLSAPNFGDEDAASRHVSGTILNAIFAFFQKKHGS